MLTIRSLPPPWSRPSANNLVAHRLPSGSSSPLKKPLPPPQPLSMETPLHQASRLKDHILKEHPHSSFSFSLIHMRKVAVPPVQIPRMYRSARAKSMVVGGHNVPYTRTMWDNQMRYHRSHSLDSIHEHVVYDCG